MRDDNYREAILTYIDVLGFKKLVEKSVADARLFSEILGLLRDLKYQTRHSGLTVFVGDEPLHFCRAFNFSDLTVRVSYTDTPAKSSTMCQWEFLSLCRIQVELACGTDFLVRGAISTGLISMDPDGEAYDDTLFGPALIRAYEMEKEKPGPPRIVIDPPVVKAAGRHSGGSPWRQFFHKDADGKFFIDYLFGAAVDGLYFVNEPIGPLETFQAHKDAVERRIKNLKDPDAGVVEKHRWLVSYHNGAVERLKKYSWPDDPYSDCLRAQARLRGKDKDVPDSLKIDPAMISASG